MASSPASSRSPAGAPGVIVPYRMHVSQKYLDLTKQKLELTRLPREPQLAHQQDSGISKAHLEQLVDHWTDQYSWRAQERFFNDTLPQYRMNINGTRVHFVHRRSTSANAIPLLFIHGWPESFIAVCSMIDALCDPPRTPPRGDEDAPAFHVVVPSIPGFGFSDQVQEDGNNLVITAVIFNALMNSLGYDRYVIHGSGWGFKIGRRLALTHSESCIGIHTANLEPQRLSHNTQLATSLSPRPQVPNLEHCQTMAYALCDSPAGLLAQIVDAIKPSVQSSPPQMDPWNSTTLINWTMLHWLPGPEAALRWLDNSTSILPALWTSFSNVPLAISQYGDPATAQSAPVWAEHYHPISMVRQRPGIVRFAAWERPADMVHDIRDFVRSIRPTNSPSFPLYAAGSVYGLSPY